MQTLTPKLQQAYALVSPGGVSSLDEGDDYLRAEANLSRAAVQSLDHAALARAVNLIAAELQKIYFDVSVLPSHQIVPTDSTWQERLRKYLEDALLFDEQWTAKLSTTIDKAGLVERTALNPIQFHVVPTFLTSTLLHKRELPIRDQLRALFPDARKKTVFVLLDRELFYDGPFLCVTDWAHLACVSYSAANFTEAGRHAEVLQRECTWQGADFVCLPEFFDFSETVGSVPELLSWLISLKGLLSLCAIANVTAMDGKQTHLIFWGNTKRQLALTGATALNAATAANSYALYSWIYRDVPHPVAALRIARNFFAQQLESNSESNPEVLSLHLPDIAASARANYAAFVEEKLKDFFTLSKELSSYTTTASEYLYKTLSDLNESLRKSVLTVLGVVGGVLLSTSAVQLNPLTYTTILAVYSLFIFCFNVWYLPATASSEFTDHLRHFQDRLAPYREFLNANQSRQLFENLPREHQTRFGRTRILVRLVNSLLACLVLCLSGFDISRVAKFFTFVPTWPLGRGIEWFVKRVIDHL